MRHSPTERSQPKPKKRVVVYHVAPSSFFGRLLAFVLAVAIVVAALFVSLLVFWVILTIVLCVVVYAWWASRRGYSGKSRDINVDHRQE